MKPAFVVLIAWLFGETAKRPEMPANSIALALLIVVVALLVMQPDFGQTMLVSLVWGALFYMAGMRLIWVIGLAGAAGARPHRGLLHRSARRAAHQPLPRSGLRRHLQHRYRDGILHPRRLVRPRPGRRHHQAHPARRPHRLRLRGGGGRIRRRALSHSGRAVCVHCDPRADQGDAHRRSVHPFCRGRTRHPVRPAIDHQHGGQSASDAGQGNDIAVRVLWRLVADLARLRHGHAGGADPRAAARQARRRQSARGRGAV